MSRLSIIIPVYYNESNLFPLYDKLLENVLNKLESEYEIIFVDDGSEDNSYNKMMELSKKDSNIRLLKLSRNFGSHAAILAGFTYCKGDCAVAISADLQDPPEIILEMYEKWKNGNRVILAVREDREESFMQKTLSNTYYNFMRKFALKNMPKNGFDCVMIDRKVIDILAALEEKNTSIMCQILWCGFKTECIYYVRKKREIGKSKWTLSKKIKLFMDSMLSFSYIPIRMILTVGCIFSFIAFIWGIAIILLKLLKGMPVEGWTSLILILLFSFGLIMIMLGIIGEYIWRNLDETRKRPPFIIEEKNNI